MNRRSLLLALLALGALVGVLNLHFGDSHGPVHPPISGTFDCYQEDLDLLLDIWDNSQADLEFSLDEELDKDVSEVPPPDIVIHNISDRFPYSKTMTPCLGRLIVLFRELARRNISLAGMIALHLLRSDVELLPQVSECLILTLGKWKDQSTAPVLLEIATNSPVTRLRVAALTSLASSDPHLALGLASTWAWYETDLKRVAIRVLGRIEHPLAARALDEIAVAEPDPQIIDLVRRIRETDSKSSFMSDD